MREGKETDRIKRKIYQDLREIEKNNQLTQKKVVLFGCTMWAKTLLTFMEKDGIRVSAFVDNNPKKAGGMCQGLPVFLPKDYLPGRSGEIVVIICSGYWMEMCGQLEQYGYEQKKSYFVIIYDDSTGHFLQNSVKVYKGFAIYKNLIKKYGKKQMFLCPYGASGDTYMAGIFFKKYLEEKCINDYLFLVESKLSAKTAHMFHIHNIVVISQEQKGYLLDAWVFFGTEIIPLKPLLYWGWKTKHFPNPDMNLELTFFDLMKYDVFEFEESIKPTIPSYGGKNFVKDFFAKNGLEKGNTVVLAPYAGSYESGIPIEIWQKIADKLGYYGFCVCTNSAGEKEPILKGTKGIWFPLRMTVPILNEAGYFIGTRSGFCDIASSAKCKFIVLYERALNAVKYEFFSFQRMGLNDKALEFVYGGEDTETFVQNIIKELVNGRDYTIRNRQGM